MSGSCGWFPLRYDEILAWVDGHVDQLPRTLAELNAYPVAFRRVIVNRVGPEQRTRFWREHLLTFLNPDSMLTSEQRAFVQEIVGELPDIFANSLVDVQAKMRPFESRIPGLFERQQAAAMFGMVGTPEPPEGLPLPPGTRLTPVEH